MLKNANKSCIYYIEDKNGRIARSSHLIKRRFYAFKKFIYFNQLIASCKFKGAYSISNIFKFHSKYFTFYKKVLIMLRIND